MVPCVWPAQITGRVKELYKLENGKYVAPAVVEKALLEHPLVAQGTDTRLVALGLQAIFGLQVVLTPLCVVVWCVVSAAAWREPSVQRGPHLPELGQA